MKKVLLSCLTLAFSASLATAQVRYLEEVFPSTELESDVEFGRNWSFLLGATPDSPLNTDVYKPVGDAATDRAAVIVLHTGNFLPKYLNQSPSGNNGDSAIVVTSEMFAKRGYVAFAPNYRLGWLPTQSNPDGRRGSLLNAVYRSLNDVKTLVRYIKKSVAEDGNPYGVDPDKIIVYGHGSGGYLSLAYGSLDRIEELENEASGKWISTSDVLDAQTADTLFYANELYINEGLVGGIDGFGGMLNDSNHYGYTNDVVACVNVGGALGDSAWMEAGEPPLISFHCPDDGFAPFATGTVIVPTTGETVVDVVGSRWAIGQANALGNNDPLYNGKTFNDPYTQAAEAALAANHQHLNLNADDYKGLFPFRRDPIAFPFQESSPWQWWDDQTEHPIASIFLTSQGATDMLQSANAGSPTMSAAQGKAYLDSIHGFLAPRLRELLMQDVSIEESEFVDANTFVYPNPANDYLVVKTRQGIRIKDVEIYNMSGALVRTESGLNKLSHQINGIDQFTPGLYLVKVRTDQGLITRKALVE
ncbi:MAG: T9SS type A sorting domain-containing protein [Flavobacteriales bacterium]